MANAAHRTLNEAVSLQRGSQALPRDCKTSIFRPLFMENLDKSSTSVRFSHKIPDFDATATKTGPIRPVIASQRFYSANIRSLSGFLRPFSSISIIRDDEAAISRSE
jgi:hypothetical protein